MEAKGFVVGMTVKVDRCDKCPAIIGRSAKITGFSNDSGFDAVELNFGRGRPQAGRPKCVGVLDISLLKE